ncbi:MAG TPA: hypothetical protein DCX53_05130, partial [Anaerolineae bacterium]|nr:hypothetical protein [Anaerolineae bacterium]
MRKSVFLIVVIALSACNYYPSTTKAAATPNTIDITNTSMPPSSIPPTEMHLPPVIVDPNTMNHKLLMGYQGWFTCPGDGANTGWFHWFKDDIPDAAHFRVDMFPDASELTPEERCETGMKYPNGETAPLYSAYNPKTVMRHFQWMSDYEIDGIFLQRFVGELADPIYSNQRNIVLKNVRAAAEAHGRVFAIMYDISGMDSTTLIEEVEHDWKYLTNILKVTESPAYLRHDGKPVLAIWGLGFNGRPGTPGQAMELVNFFKNNDEQKYEVTLMGGVPTWWRELKNDSLTDPAWADYYCALDVISPWTVGRYSTDSEVDQYRSVMEADMKRVAECGAQYMPVVFPGTAFHNDSGSPFNSTPRRGGELYWRQVHNAVSIGVPMIYNAMFDEVDEGTAMYKIAATKNDQPAGVDLISMDTDGVKLPNDWYLRLAGAATKMLRGEIPNTERIPLNPDGSLVSTFPTVEPTPVQFKARIQITTTSDWTTLSMLSGGQLSGVEIISSNSEGDASFDDLTFT